MQNLIFIHGAFYDGSVWDQVVPLITSKEWKIYCPTLTRASPVVNFTTHIQDISNLINTLDRNPITLVGHRYGGMIITEIAKLFPNKIKHLIYLDSVVPLPNESLIDVMGERAKSLEVVDGWKVIPNLKSLGIEGHPWSKSHVFPQSYHCFTGKTSSEPLKESIRKSYILTTDKGPMGHIQAKRVEDQGGTVYEIQGSHSPMVTDPITFAENLKAILQ